MSLSPARLTSEYVHRLYSARAILFALVEFYLLSQFHVAAVRLVDLSMILDVLFGTLVDIGWSPMDARQVA
jgi:hypothetical protein